MNEFERVRRRILMNKSSAPFPYYVKINQNFKDFTVSGFGLANYEEFISVMNDIAGMEVVKGDYIVDVFYNPELFSLPTDVIDLILFQQGWVSELKVSNSIKDVLTYSFDTGYFDYTASLINLEDINTYDINGEKGFGIFSIEQLSENTLRQGALEKLTLPKNINNTSFVNLDVHCYLDSRDVEIIHSPDERVGCLFLEDIKFAEGNPTNKFILKVPTDKIAAFTTRYSQLEQHGTIHANYQIVGY